MDRTPGADPSRKGWFLGPVVSSLLIAAVMIITYVAFGEAALQELGTSRTEVVVLLGIAALVADIFLPIPSSVVIVLVAHAAGPLPAIFAGTVGLSVGCALGYYVGRLGSRSDLHLVDPNQADRISNWLRGPGGVQLLAVLRPVPIIGETSLIVAGLLRLNPAQVLAITTLANLALTVCYVLLAAQAESWGGFVASILAAWALPGFVMLAWWLIRRATRRTAADSLDTPSGHQNR